MSLVLHTTRSGYALSMPAIHRRIIESALLCCAIAVPATAADWVLLSERAHHVQLGASTTGEVIELRTTGSDPYLVGRWEPKPGRQDRVLEFEYFCPAGIDEFSAFVGPPFSERQHAQLPDIPIAEGWQLYTADLVKAFGDTLPADARLLRLDFGVRPDVRIKIRNVRTRAQSASEKRAIAEQETRRKQKINQAKRIADYLQHSPPTSIESVIVGTQLVQISGPVPKDIESWQLLEYPPEKSIDDDGVVVEAIVDVSEGHFHMAIPRKVDSRDRLHSGWRLRDSQGNYLTARQYANDIRPSSNDFAAARPSPASQKGLTGFSRRGPPQDLLDLGISAVTINLVLNQFISRSPGPGRTRFPDADDIYFDQRHFDYYDALIDFARQNKIVVTAIVLIPSGKSAASRSLLVHPESDGGVYAMPDISSARAAKIYAYLLHRIADRYSHTGKSPGGITNWIAHNEVDFHKTWTNMGDQPRQVYTETFYRSLRMIHNAARSHNPQARVFVPLTHHWLVPDDGSWQRLAPRECLETLQRYSTLEGDFAWGVAYHPYPKNLFAKVAWQDTNIGNDFDTPLITMQNIEVLGKFLQQPAMRTADGNMRPVLLSEQGYHTDSYDEASQANQAGSLWYAMRQVRQLPWIESFLYHRWIDHPDEGGLKLGLRTLPTARHPHGQKKTAWYVYQAIGTKTEAEVTENLPRP